MQKLDVVIVGGGPAGVSTALFLAHAWPTLTDRIVVLEKERYPRDKYCAGGVGARADNLLGSIGVTVDVPSVWLRGIAVRALGTTKVVRDSEPGVIGRVVRRIEFDHELYRIAARRGIQIREGVRVSGVEVRADGVEVNSSAGPLLAQAVVAADGVGSSVRKSLGIQAARYHAQALEIDTEPVDGDVERDLLLFDVSNRKLPGYYWDFPTIVDQRELVCRGVYLLKTARDERTIEINDVLSMELRRRGLDLERYKKKRFAERGFELHSPLARRRVLLVGEAAGIDPVTGEGIAQAIQYGAVAGRYLARKVKERDFEFGDWQKEVSSTMIGRDLITRTLGVPLFYGAYRANVERFLLDTPDFVRVGLQHFAGKRWSRRALVNAAWGATWHGLRALAGSSGDRESA